MKLSASRLALRVGAIALLASCVRIDSDALLQRAEDAVDERDYNAAILDLRTITSREDGNLPAHRLLLESYLATGNANSAMYELGILKSAGESSDEFIAASAEARLLSGEYGTALETLSYSTAADSNMSDRFRIISARSLLGLGEFDAVRSTLAQLEDESLSMPAVLLLRANLHLAEGCSRCAEPLLAEAIEIDSGNIEALVLRGGLKLKRGDAETAISDLSEASRLAGRSGHLPYHVQGLQLLMGAYLSLDRVSDAERVLREIKARYPKSVIAHQSEALWLHADEQPDEALSSAQRAIAMAPDSVPTLLVGARLAAKASKYAQAEVFAKRALSLDVSNLSATRLLAALKMQQRRYQEAEELLRKADSQGNTASVQFVLASSLARLAEGDSDSAIGLLEDYLTLDPENTAVKAALARAFLQSGNSGRATQFLIDALGRTGEDAFVERIVEVIAQLQRGDDASAYTQIESLLSEHGDREQSWMLAASVYQIRGKLADAEAALTRALTISPQFESALRARGDLYRAMGELDDARRDYQSLLSRNSNDLHAMMGLAVVHAASGQRDAAISVLQLAGEEHAESLPVWVGLARLLMMEGRVEESRSAVEQAFAIDPESTLAQFTSAQLDYFGGRAELGLKRMASLVARNPDNRAIRAVLVDLYAERGDYFDAARTLAPLADSAPQNASVKLRLCRFFLRGNMTEDAMKCLADAMDRPNPELSTIREAADIHLAANNFTQAASMYERALRQSADPADALRLAQAQFIGRIGNPVELLGRWTSSHPNEAGLWALLGDIHLARGDAAPATDYYEKTLAIDSAHVTAANNLAWLLRDRDISRALELSRIASQIAPDNAEVLDTRGWILVADGNFSEAASTLRRAAEISENAPEVLYHLAVAEHELGRRDDAVSSLLQALESDRDFPSRELAERLADTLNVRMRRNDS